ncbi:MAG: hypothetical protein LBK54_01700 [Propionibacteriaceae bacterium]|jgi:hypothetical protein|nr:hypothetical protein [Propionibacteriaceae bacterium]
MPDYADLIRPAPAGPPEPAQADGTDTPYGLSALGAECDRLALAVQGERNDTLNRAAFNINQLVLAGKLMEGTATAALWDAAGQCGLTREEPSATRATIRSAIRGARQKPRVNVPETADRAAPPVTVGWLDPADAGVTNHTSVTVAADQDHPWWAGRPELEHIVLFARSRMTAWPAVMMCVILRALAHTPPLVVLPPMIGGPGSLNLFAALVGSSGAGKGAAMSAARDCVDWPTASGDRPLFEATLGTGEGMTRAYKSWGKDGWVWDRREVLWTVPEVDALTALSGRTGATLMPQLRNAYSGEALGFMYADTQRRCLLGAHEYRFTLQMGVQPERAASLLEDADGGTTQRFLWAPAWDPEITADPPEEPPAWSWRPPAFTDLLRPDRQGRLVIDVPGDIVGIVREAHAARARGEGTALDGHAILTRLKVAEGLAVLAGRPSLDWSDWDLSGQVMSMSDRCRFGVQRTLAQARLRQETAAVERDARRSDQLDAHQVARVAEKLARAVVKAGPDGLNRRGLTLALNARDRPFLADALVLAQAKHHITTQIIDGRTVYVAADKEGKE